MRSPATLNLITVGADAPRGEEVGEVEYGEGMVMSYDGEEEV